MEEALNLTELIDNDVVKLDLKAISKREAIEELTDLLINTGVIISKTEFVSDVFEREEQGETGIGNGIAIPHGKSSSVIKTAIAIGRSKVDLEWETIDNQPVRNVILFAVRDQDKTNLHLKLLAKIAGSLANDTVCQKLKYSKTPNDIIQALENG
ncbi:PTS sugar transporter subunit IIA [Staphylococcus pseudoxylosus]|uniref:PTS sugar transporter subunit IIA n=1 Tax=Staphylococcus pseudoxylosus TaxID=2282419 RepID=UPI002DBCB623|nr:PTS sugar transporter subunit IIA [Staphylococcus pseudoxylosus]MEB6038095.1 PTS sugar transporter subunit IIA [Staphylococcus pseudoxylosus]MEB7765348.1 PTS sugar transporter subunit IIA [Staphylococcus pseudoxylosus]MEB8086061.1 PTS sugar transporter subunit IIA [Staphylococcus pseudoxylosus]